MTVATVASWSQCSEAVYSLHAGSHFSGPTIVSCMGTILHTGVGNIVSMASPRGKSLKTKVVRKVYLLRDRQEEAVLVRG